MDESVDVEKAALFRELGLGGDLADVEALLQEHGLSSPRKTRVHRDKIPRIRELVAARWALVCARTACQAEARALDDGRSVRPAADAAACELCGGKAANARAVDAIVDACRRAGWTRLVVVGGSPNARLDLEQGVGARIRLRLVDGTASRRLEDARADEAWADRVVLWGATQLNHKVSTLYRGPTVIQMCGRGMQALADAVRDSADASLSARRASRGRAGR